MSSIESKRVQYRKYLERAGVIDALSKALIKLYEEQNKPEDAVRFVRKFMCEACPDDAQFDAMKADLNEAKKQISKLEQDLERAVSQIKKTPEEIAELLETGFASLIEDEVDNKSLLRKYLTKEILDEYQKILTPPPVEATILDCIQSGLKHHNSAVGVYAADQDSYTVFTKLFDPLIREYHGLVDVEDEVLTKEADWGNADEIDNLDPDRKYIVSTRIRLARNLKGLPHFPVLREKQFTEIEQKVKTAVEGMVGEFKGAYYPMSMLDDETQKEMVARDILFKRGDEYLQTAGCYRFWPTGRGVFNNPAETFLVWVNEEDHLRIISMAKCGDLGDVYNRLIKGIQELEKTLVWATSPKYGNITTCPTNLGTTMRASVHIRLPLLSKSKHRLARLAKELNLQIRGTGGEHTPIVDGVMDVSNSRRLGYTEFDIVKNIQDGIVALIKAEEDLVANGDEDDEDEDEDD